MTLSLTFQFGIALNWDIIYYQDMIFTQKKKIDK